MTKPLSEDWGRLGGGGWGGSEERLSSLAIIHMKRHEDWVNDKNVASELILSI